MLFDNIYLIWAILLFNLILAHKIKLN